MKVIALMRNGTLKKFSFVRSKENYRVWNFTLCGPVGSPWAGLMLKGSLTFPSSFPRGSLNFTFSPALWHPNVSSSGIVCLGDEGSSAADRIERVLMLLHEFLLIPNPDNPYNSEAARLYKADRRAYDMRAREDAKKKFAEY